MGMMGKVRSTCGVCGRGKEGGVVMRGKGRGFTCSVGVRERKEGWEEGRWVECKSDSGWREWSGSRVREEEKDLREWNVWSLKKYIARGGWLVL